MYIDAAILMEAIDNLFTKPDGEQQTGYIQWSEDDESIGELYLYNFDTTKFDLSSIPIITVLDEVNRIIEYNKSMEYRVVRKNEYPSIGDQLDMLFHELETDGSISVDGEWSEAIKEVKEAHPKPE